MIVFDRFYLGSVKLNRKQLCKIAKNVKMLNTFFVVYFPPKSNII